MGQWNDEGRTAVLTAFNEKGHIAAIKEMFKMNEKYGNEGCLMSAGIKVRRYLKLKNYDKVMDYYEKAYELKMDLIITYIATNLRGYNQMKDNPRYIELLKKMNLPLE